MGGIQTIDVRLAPPMPAGASTVRSPRHADAIARAAEGADPQRRGRSTRRSGARSGEQGRAAQSLSVAVPEPQPAHNVPQDIPLTIVFEDEHLLVVDKPAGLVVHPAAGNLDGTLVNALLHHCAGRLSGIGGVARPGIVHRIDKDTSGLMVVAKTDVAHEGLAKQFAAHSIDRRYLAIVTGVPKASRGTIDAPLARSAANRKKIAIVEGSRGKRAVTHWKRLESLQRGGAGRMPAGNRADPPGARPHGLDRPSAARRPGLRARRKDAWQDTEKLGFHRQALHAAELGFTHPVTKRRLSFASPMPPTCRNCSTHLVYRV